MFRDLNTLTVKLQYVSCLCFWLRLSFVGAWVGNPRLTPVPPVVAHLRQNYMNKLSSLLHGLFLLLGFSFGWGKIAIERLYFTSWKLDGFFVCFCFYLFYFFDVCSREICASFGGLLMLLKADPSDAQKLELDQRLFILIRKV